MFSSKHYFACCTHCPLRTLPIDNPGLYAELSQGSDPIHVETETEDSEDCDIDSAIPTTVLLAHVVDRDSELPGGFVLSHDGVIERSGLVDELDAGEVAGSNTEYFLSVALSMYVTVELS